MLAAWLLYPGEEDAGTHWAIDVDGRNMSGRCGDDVN
jgi:hypothetical protein